MGDPVFSIIIPTFNSEVSLGLTLRSILNQRFSNYEILILDGDSTDNTLLIAKQIKDPRIQIFSDPDAGAYDAMNKAITLAKGKWLYFLGSDDWFFNEFVLENIFESIKKTSLPVIYGNVLIKGDTGWAKDGEIYAGKFSRYRLTEKNICHQAIFYKRQFLNANKLKFDLAFPVSSDWDFNLKCRKISNFRYLKVIVAQFNSGGLSSFRKDGFPALIGEKYPEMIRPYWQKRFIYHFIKRRKTLSRVKCFINK